MHGCYGSIKELKDRVVSDCAREVSLHACMVQVYTDVCLYGSFHTSGPVVNGLGAMVGTLSIIINYKSSRPASSFS